MDCPQLLALRAPRVGAVGVPAGHLVLEATAEPDYGPFVGRLRAQPRHKKRAAGRRTRPGGADRGGSKLEVHKFDVRTVKSTPRRNVPWPLVLCGYPLNLTTGRL